MDILQDFIGNRLRGALVGGGAHPQDQPGLHAFVHEAVDAGRSGSFPLSISSINRLVLRLCMAWMSVIFFLRLHFFAETTGVQVVLHPFFAAPHLEQLVIILLIPIDVEAHLLEGLIKRDPVPISFGVDDHTVLVEKNRFNLSHQTLFDLPPGFSH